MVTFNQELYIAQAIDSVLMQKTTFPFKLIIGEDGSSDSTLAICQLYAKKYPDKIKLIANKANLGLVKNYQSVFKECTAKYLAILEGDDFWTDKYKLQKQFEALENDPDLGMVHTNFTLYDDVMHKSYKPPRNALLDGHIFYSLIIDNYIGPLTVMLRKSILDQHLDFEIMIKEKYQTIDIAMWLEISYNSKVAYLNEILAAYRKKKGSISIPHDFDKLVDFTQTQLKTLKYFSDKYPINKSIQKEVYNTINYNLMLKSIHYNRFDKTSLYRRQCKPAGIVEIIRHQMAKHIFLIKAGKFLKIFN